MPSTGCVASKPKGNFVMCYLHEMRQIYDHRSSAESMLHLTRPYLHEFLTAVYANGYDICFWSATSMKWIHEKLNLMGVLRHTDYRIVFCLDAAAMVSVYSSEEGRLLSTKPLGVIWAQFPEYFHALNTLHLDDIRRNFLMNPLNGLRIKACRRLPLTRESDTELLRLLPYLLGIAKLSPEDLMAGSGLDHRRWQDWKYPLCKK